MDITFSCSHCGQQLAVDESGAGLSLPCPKCGENLPIPATPTAKGTGSPERSAASGSKRSSGAVSSPQAFQHRPGKDVFHISRDGKIKGPYTLQELAELYYRGLVQSDTVYSKNNSEHWHPISDIPMLRYAQPAPPHAPAPSTPAGTASRKSAATSPGTKAVYGNHRGFLKNLVLNLRGPGFVTVLISWLLAVVAVSIWADESGRKVTYGLLSAFIAGSFMVLASVGHRSDHP
jgi:phage FluMu protein Com